MKIDWFTLVRDILIVVVLGALGTLAVSVLVGGMSPLIQIAVVFVMLTAGFTLCGCLKGAGRFRHLSLVAVGAVAVTLLDGLLREPARATSTLIVSSVVVSVAMLVGGALSLAIRSREPAGSASAD